MTSPSLYRTGVGGESDAICEDKRGENEEEEEEGESLTFTDLGNGRSGNETRAKGIRGAAEHNISSQPYHHHLVPSLLLVAALSTVYSETYQYQGQRDEAFPYFHRYQKPVKATLIHENIPTAIVLARQIKGVGLGEAL
ncbi:hypothetical protein PoB_002425100 [Plakobranchus ocellatus]|uniref:Uncharacterized protein n=1 Tax=Plakobranchus ocellatus TaxID=259542 RepID=A0AAV3ZEU2_9GAST|nr:hypothetical protein PoB_002425100 [Plakobranchus ocellatus]